MGVFKALSGSFGGVMADQWLEVYTCDSFSEDVLAQRVMKKTGVRSSNNEGDPDVVSDGSLVIVNAGQCALLIDRGQVVDYCDSPGSYEFHSERSGSLFAKGGLKSVIKQGFDRFGYGGVAAVYQVVIFLDTREHMANPFYLNRAVNIRDRGNNMRFDAQVQISGMFSFRITDPPVFYKNVCGNSTGTVYKHEVFNQLTTELEMQLSMAISEIMSVEGVTPTELSCGLDDVLERATAIITEKWTAQRGIGIVSLAADTSCLIPKDLKLLQSTEWAKALTDPKLAAGMLIGAQGKAMRDAANNAGKVKVTWGFTPNR